MDGETIEKNDDGYFCKLCGLDVFNGCEHYHGEFQCLECNEWTYPVYCDIRDGCHICGSKFVKREIEGGINVLSLFDGHGSGLLALKRAGIKVANYYASEIDKNAILISNKNHSEIINLGDVGNWENWNLPGIDLIIGGSPCQGFSMAGSKLNFNDPRSRLFFRFAECLEFFKPKNFFLENVRMSEDDEKVITKYLGVEPHELNSALVSAQNRVRLYWTDIPYLFHPQEKSLFLSDIIEKNPSDSIGERLIEKQLKKLGKSGAKRSGSLFQWLDLKFPENFTVSGNCYKTELNGKLTKYYKCDRKFNVKRNQEKASCLTGGMRGDGNHSDMDIIVIEPDIIRRLTLTESERLQTLPDGYTEGVSNTQRYKMISNGWTIDIIAHFFEGLK